MALWWPIPKQLDTYLCSFSLIYLLSFSIIKNRSQSQPLKKPKNQNRIFPISLKIWENRRRHQYTYKNGVIYIFLQFWKMGTLLSISSIFMSSIPKNRRILPRARSVHERQNFHFRKIARTLIFFLLQKPSFYIKVDW